MQRLKPAMVLMCACLGLAYGCNSSKDEGREFGAGDDVVNESPEHEHVHGPHDGHILELGDEEYHAEVVMDETTRKLAVYILGPDAATAAPIAATSVTLELEGETAPLTLTAAPQAGETDGASQYELAGDGLPARVTNIEEVQGKLTIVTAEKTYEADLSDHDHDHGDHDHAHGDDHDHK